MAEVEYWVGKPLRQVVEELKDGWYWYSPGIPHSWGVAIEKALGGLVDELTVIKADYETGHYGWGPNFHYWYKLVLKVDRDIGELSRSITTKGDVIFGSARKGITIEGDTITLTAEW